MYKQKLPAANSDSFFFNKDNQKIENQTMYPVPVNSEKLRNTLTIVLDELTVGTKKKIISANRGRIEKAY